jgi:RNA-binding protein 5/10
VETLGENNIGNKLLRAMGWQQGEGLGRQSTGMTAPVQVQMRADRAGLGAEGAVVGTAEDAASTYAETARRKARARLESLKEKESQAK